MMIDNSNLEDFFTAIEKTLEMLKRGYLIGLHDAEETKMLIRELAEAILRELEDDCKTR